MRIKDPLCIALSTWTRLPVPKAEWTDGNRRLALCFFPLAGVAVGGAVWLWLAVCGRLGFGPLLRGAAAAALPLLLTGGIHMDGFMDTCDALASWQTRERRLEILKDSHTGAFAVMRCALYLLLQAAMFGELGAERGKALVCCFVLSRALSAALAVTMPSARPEGMLGGFTRGAGRAVTIASALWAAAAAVPLALWGGWPALPLAAGAVLLYRYVAMKHFGGVTGDLAGWFLQAAELAMLAGVVLG